MTGGGIIMRSFVSIARATPEGTAEQKLGAYAQGGGGPACAGRQQSRFRFLHATEEPFESIEDALSWKAGLYRFVSAPVRKTSLSDWDVDDHLWGDRACSERFI